MMQAVDRGRAEDLEEISFLLMPEIILLMRSFTVCEEKFT